MVQVGVSDEGMSERVRGWFRWSGGGSSCVGGGGGGGGQALGWGL